MRRSGAVTGRPLRVATVITRMSAGAGGVALRGALALDPARYEVTVITGAAGLDGRALAGRGAVLRDGDALDGAPVGDLLAEAYAGGLTVIRLADLTPRISPLRDRAALAALTRLLTEGRYDVAHTHTAKAGALGRIAAAQAGIPRIVHTLHGLPFHQFQSPWRRALYAGIERRLGRRTDALLAVGAATAAEAVRRGLVPPDRIRVVPPAVEPRDPPRDRAARLRARRLLDVPPGARVVGTVGRADYQKAPEHWLDAVAAAGDDVWAVWIGDGPRAGRLLARARARGLAGQFRWLGHRADVPALLPGLDVFALASRYEGLPCALIEAMQAGVPVAATAVNGVPELVAPGLTGLLAPPERPALLAQAIRHLLDCPDQARRMATAAAAQLGDRFTPKALGEILEQTYTP